MGRDQVAVWQVKDKPIVQCGQRQVISCSLADVCGYNSKLALVKIRIALSGIKNLHLNERMGIKLNQVQLSISILKPI